MENWLCYLLSKNADFEFLETDIDGKHVEMIRIQKALNEPVAFQKMDYIRSGIYTKKLHEFPVFRAQLWDKLRHAQFEDVCVKTYQGYEDVIRLLQVDAYFTVLIILQPTEKDAVVYYLNDDEIIQKQDNGLYSITNLGVLLFAKDLNEFARLGRKAMRVVQYKGVNRLLIQKEETFKQGYAVCFENIIRYVNALLSSNEDVNANSLRRVSSLFLQSERSSRIVLSIRTCILPVLLLLPESSSSSSSRLIKEAIGQGLIKVLDPDTAPRYMKYIPICA